MYEKRQSSFSPIATFKDIFIDTNIAFLSEPRGHTHTHTHSGREDREGIQERGE